MRIVIVLSLSVLTLGGLPASSQTNPDSVLSPAPRNVTATGRTMPPAPSRSSAAMKPSVEAEMMKAQKSAETRNKAWDAKMRRTMGTICTGC